MNSGFCWRIDSLLRRFNLVAFVCQTNFFISLFIYLKRWFGDKKNNTHCNNNNFRLRFIAGFVPNVWDNAKPAMKRSLKLLLYSVCCLFICNIWRLALQGNNFPDRGDLRTHSLPFSHLHNKQKSALCHCQITEILVQATNIPIFSIFSTKMQTLAKKWKAESRSTRTDLSWEHKNWRRCNSKFFAKINQSLHFFDERPLSRQGVRPFSVSLDLLLPPLVELKTHQRRLRLFYAIS